MAVAVTLLTALMERTGTAVTDPAPAPMPPSSPHMWLSVIRLSRASYRQMIQKLWWAAGYNVAAIPLAAGVLAWAGIVLSPALGAALVSLSTVVVTLNPQLLAAQICALPEAGTRSRKGPGACGAPCRNRCGRNAASN